MPKVSVIILSWNRKKDTLATIESLAGSKINNFSLEICIVDNGSTDGSVGVVEKLLENIQKEGKIQTKLIKLSQNLGFAAGNNVGLRDAMSRSFDYIALLNDDTEVDPGLIGSIIKEHESNKHAGAISAKIYFAKGNEYHKNYSQNELGKVIWYAGGDIDWNNVYGSNRGVDEVDHGQFDETWETDFTTGCFVMYKRKALEDVGLYDERYFAYMEDADHAVRLKKAGWKVLYSGKGTLWHKVSQSSGIGSELNDYFLTRNRMLFGFAYASLRTKFALFRESVKLLLNGRKWQKIGIRDYYMGNYRKGSWK